MANPRQRRKSRSGTAKVKYSKASAKNLHKVTVKGPQKLAENWDKTKTVRQNYAKLGLLPKLNPRQAGGIEPIEAIPRAIASAIPASFDLADLSDDSSSESEDEDEPMPSTSATTSTTTKAPERKLAKGEGRIIRDSEGKIVKIVIGGDFGEEMEEDVVESIARGEDDSEDEDEDEESEEEVVEKEKSKGTPWGQPMKDWDGDDEPLESEEEDLGPRSIGQGIPIGGKRRKVLAKTDVVREMEALAATQRSVVRHTSLFEHDWLLSLVDKYGDDVESMARDRKANPWQKTAGELKRAVMKAGGFSKLKAKIARLEAALEAEQA